MNKNKKQIIDSLKNTYCRIKNSKINGVGVFAIKDIPKGVNPFGVSKKTNWQKFNVNELKNLDKEVLKMIEDFFTIQKDGSLYMPNFGLNGMDISFFMNHSKNPNVKMANDEVNFISLKKIRKNQELTVSYDTYYE